MAAINDLLRQVNDTALRDRLTREFHLLSKNKKFGLVFEEHIPECTPLYSVPIRRGTSVALRSGRVSDVYTVVSVGTDTARCLRRETGETSDIPLTDLVVVAQFGEAIFPTLTPVDKVENAPDDDLWHTIIEADNYHALQLLEYLYPKKVDCIYIDPPYNTGARDWKYNNDYVDSSDSWRHSKWLSMMQKRLRVAKRVLADDGVLITTIDDNEYAHLWILLNEIFPELIHTCVTVQHNPGGTQGKKFSVTHEYAIFSYSQESIIFRKQHSGGDVYNLRRWGSTSGRYEGATCFYPIILNEEYQIIGFGDLLSENQHPASQVEHNADGTILVWPVDRNGNEKKWRYARDTVETVRDRMFIERREDRVEVMLRRDSEPPKTVWTDALYNAEAHGTTLLKGIVGGGFSYPKSLYAVRDAVGFVVSGHKHALILDFFAGSGTTLHAVNLLNAQDDGNRRCILVTNNEVSDTDAKTLKESGYQPGDPEWERHGICRAITWPRTKYSILGKRDDGTVLTGEHFTNQTVTKEKNRSFVQLGFIENPATLSTAAKKQVVALLRDKSGKQQLPQSLVNSDTKFVVSERHTASILFDTDFTEDWLAALEDQDQVTDFYIVVQEPSVFRRIKSQVIELLGTIQVEEPLKRPMSEGLSTNVEYFKLDFLDRNSVTLGQQFSEILPLLWLKSGAVGNRPTVNGEVEPDMMILPDNGFAILIDETKFVQFSETMADTDSIRTVYFVTNSEEAFREMSSGIKDAQTYQLYRDYVDNFVLGARRDS